METKELEKLSFSQKYSLTDIPEMQKHCLGVSINNYNKILIKAIENHLGMPLNLERDKDRISFKVLPNGDQRLIVDKECIGIMSFQLGFDGCDVKTSQITHRISFTPNIKP